MSPRGFTSTSKPLTLPHRLVAIRILRSARELGWLTVAVYTHGDASHAGYADEAVKLENVGEYMDVGTIARIASRCVRFSNVEYKLITGSCTELNVPMSIQDMAF